jgi:hypothetical protein
MRVGAGGPEPVVSKKRSWLKATPTKKQFDLFARQGIEKPPFGGF